MAAPTVLIKFVDMLVADTARRVPTVTQEAKLTLYTHPRRPSKTSQPATINN